jgi:HAD superfamily hydrolase (TIGR01509 family)
LDARYKVYRKWAFETLIEASEMELWTRWMLPDWPSAQVAPLAPELTFLYRQTMGRRFARPDAEQVIVELSRRGYCLGILSNTITEREIPEWLEEDGLSRYFPTVVLSSIFGRRKPDPAIYLEAARRAGVDPARSAYVADNPSRDVPGSRRAGFGMVIIMMEPADLEKKAPAGETMPDLIIHEFGQLLDIFPDRHMQRAAS